MKAKTLVISLAAVLLIASTGAEAGHRGHDGYQRYHAPPRHSQARHYGHYRYARPHHRHHHGHGYRTLAGAVLLGTIVATLDRPRPAGVVVSGPAYVVRQPYSVRQNIWYQRDVNGDCFEVQLRQGGEQVWTQTHPANCR